MPKVTGLMSAEIFFCAVSSVIVARTLLRMSIPMLVILRRAMHTANPGSFEDDQIAVRFEADGQWPRQARLCGDIAVPAHKTEIFYAVSGDRSDDARIPVDLSHPIVRHIGNDQLALAIERNPLAKAE